jgi:hypothetical protein
MVTFQTPGELGTTWFDPPAELNFATIPVAGSK